MTTECLVRLSLRETTTELSARDMSLRYDAELLRYRVSSTVFSRTNVEASFQAGRQKYAWTTTLFMREKRISRDDEWSERVSGHRRNVNQVPDEKYATRETSHGQLPEHSRAVNVLITYSNFPKIREVQETSYKRRRKNIANFLST